MFYIQNFEKIKKSIRKTFIVKVELSSSKKNFLFASMIALQK